MGFFRKGKIINVMICVCVWVKCLYFKVNFNEILWIECGGDFVKYVIDLKEVDFEIY